MALGVAKVFGPVPGGGRWRSGWRLTLDSSYPTGGYALARTTLGSSANDPTFFIEIANLAKGYLPVYDHTNQKLMLYRQTAATGALVEVPNATDVSAGGAVDIIASYQLAG